MKETKLIATILSILAVYAAFYFVCLLFKELFVTQLWKTKLSRT